MINSLNLFESLKTADLPERQARAIAHAIGKAFDEDEARQAKALATKVDPAKLDAEMHRVESSLKQEISALSVELRAEIRASVAQLETKLAKTESTMIRWMFIFWIGQMAAMKYFR